MNIQFVRVELKCAGGMAILDLTRDDIVALVALADELRGLVADTVQDVEPWDGSRVLESFDVSEKGVKVPKYIRRRA